MSDKSKIEWTDATWNPVTGCSKVSRGCEKCYAGREAATILAGNPRYAGLATMDHGTPQWSGELRLHPDLLEQPLHWRNPRRIFVCSQADLFHQRVPDEFITRVFATMFKARRHTFQILTKRTSRMKVFVSKFCPGFRWPHVWLGVSIEDQKTADERIPLLLLTPAAVRFVSYEPALGPANFEHYLNVIYGPATKRWTKVGMFDSTDGRGMPAPIRYLGEAKSDIDWVIAGGESGPNARPSHPDWFRAVRDQCQAAGVPFFFKQWGEWAPDHDSHDIPGGFQYVPGEKWLHVTGGELRDGPGATWKPSEWATVRRYGKKQAGRVLDGRTWDEFPACAGRMEVR